MLHSPAWKYITLVCRHISLKQICASFCLYLTALIERLVKFQPNIAHRTEFWPLSYIRLKE